MNLAGGLQILAYAGWLPDLGGCRYLSTLHTRTRVMSLPCREMVLRRAAYASRRVGGEAPAEKPLHDHSHSAETVTRLDHSRIKRSLDSSLPKRLESALCYHWPGPLSEILGC